MNKNQTDYDPKEMARVLSLGRIAIGVAGFVAPRKFAKAWTGDTADEVASSMATRGLAARDVALGVGTLMALESGAPVRGWIEAQALADASDTFSTLANFGDLPPLKRWISLFTAGAACYMGVKVAGEID
jgi:hypothetical protein